jgi:RNA polymerase sigma-70 factor (ECF subfamily)
MESGSDGRTSPTLLGRLRSDPEDQGSWEAFVERYGRMVYRWCRRWGLQDADAQDVTQTVLAKLAVQLRTFTYDPARSFRAWLKTIAHHAWRDFLEGQRRPGRGSGDSQVLELLQSIEARDDLAQKLEEAFDRELLEAAIARVRLRVAPRTWEAYRLTALEGLSGLEAAGRLGMKVTRVFLSKSKVQKMLREEVRDLEKPPPE